MKKTTILALLIIMSGCGFTGSKQEEAGINHDDLEFVVDTMGDTGTPAEFSVEEQKIVSADVRDDFAAPDTMAKEEIANIEEPSFEEFTTSQQSVKESKPTIIKSKNTPSSSAFAQEETYRVQKGDTLMMIAFKIYGDYRKWKDIKELNHEKLQSKLSHGMELKYHVTDTSFNWKPEGMPHMVKNGDTLGTISTEKYGTPKRWKSIYENNRPLIRNPNLIFAGFTIYYKPDRDLASQPK
jgi:nucleoid-associated protein YgaU